MIKLQIIGHLGKDAIVKEVNGKNVINFSVAHTDKFKGHDGVLKERTTWVECAYWSDRTAIAPYLTKGTTVYVEGSPEADAYLNKENQAQATLRVRVHNIQLLGSRNQQQGAAAPANTTNAAPAVTGNVLDGPASGFNDAADDLPF